MLRVRPSGQTITEAYAGRSVRHVRKISNQIRRTSWPRMTKPIEW